MNQIGATKLKYGVVMDTGTHSFVEDDTVYASGRLGLAENECVGKPTKGMKFLR